MPGSPVPAQAPLPPFPVSQAENINERSGGKCATPSGRGSVTEADSAPRQLTGGGPGQPQHGAAPGPRYSLAARCHAPGGRRGVNSCSRGGISNKNLLAAYSQAGKHPRSTQLQDCRQPCTTRRWLRHPNAIPSFPGVRVGGLRPSGADPQPGQPPVSLFFSESSDLNSPSTQGYGVSKGGHGEPQQQRLGEHGGWILRLPPSPAAPRGSPELEAAPESSLSSARPLLMNHLHPERSPTAALCC